MVHGTPEKCSEEDLGTCAAGGSCRGREWVSVGQGVWAFSRNSAEDTVIRGATRLRAIAADHAAQTRSVAGRGYSHFER